ncbi:YeeE/YedE thiosulfate transporter family protein [Fuchsiella alkaliacetigena]|uniref:YeeE/YedE thiosulfate transporter family protein n=1 Tax=Fuchsiella alkaliacetigena TaxID=957042 RepID=UPI00200A567D|nr:YeeE/YedE thiosulfate transporter family protein [Fuchsiella alkaliacetigena]MCK8825463.1 YeeE/YedE family protein [Fuchsiella alkaliacetigena]
MKKNQLKTLLIILIGLGVCFFTSLDLFLIVLWLLGLLLGFALQKSSFCFAGAFLNLFLFNSTKLFRAVLTAVIISTVGIIAYQYFTPADYELIGTVIPWGGTTIFGGFLFGIGMALAGACTLITLVRLGEGYLVFVIVFIGLVIGTLIGSIHLSWWQQRFYSLAIFLPEYIGWRKAVLLQLGGLVFIYLLVKWWTDKRDT